MAVSWSTVPHASSYRVYESQTGGTYVVATTTTGTSWTSGQLTKNHSYTFEVSTLIGPTWASGLSGPSTTRTFQGSHCA